MLTFLHTYGFINWLEQHLLSCPFKNTFGFDCPGCGMQRALIALLKGDVMLSLKLYPPAIPMLLLVFFVAVHLKLGFKYGALIIKFSAVAIAAIILINYIYKIIHHQLF